MIEKPEELINNLIERLIAPYSVETLLRYLKTILKRRIEKKEVLTFGESVKNYLLALYERCSLVTNLIFRDEPGLISKYFFPLRFQNGRNTENELTQILTKYLKERNTKVSVVTNYVIGGTAGIGKSTVLKHWSLSLIKSTNFIPIFVELRMLNNLKLSLEELLYRELEIQNVRVSEEIFKYFLNYGFFVVFLDGFDEIREKDKACTIFDGMNS